MSDGNVWHKCGEHWKPYSAVLCAELHGMDDVLEASAGQVALIADTAERAAELAHAAGAAAERARWEAAVEAERSEWVAYARAGGLPRHDEAGAALTALDELLKLLEKVNEA